MMSAQKRNLETVDPDYVDAGEQQAKRQRAVEKDAKEAVSRKIQAIVQNEFQKEINLKETELQNIDKRLNEALLLMDRLRACIVATYYGPGKTSGSSSQTSTATAPPPSIHPSVKKYLGKAPKGQERKTDFIAQPTSSAGAHERLGTKQVPTYDIGRQGRKDPQMCPPVPTVATDNVAVPSALTDRSARFKIKKKIIVGNVSKYIPVDNREANDMSSHKWMVYVRGPKSDPAISGFVRKVWFFLHHSYKPNDLVEISSPPFHLTRRGWGEFPVRVQLHFVDPRNKKVDIIHHLKLDKTFTGLQTLGAETVVEVEINRDSSSTSASSSSTSLPACSDKSSLQESSSSLSAEGKEKTAEMNGEQERRPEQAHRLVLSGHTSEESQSYEPTMLSSNSTKNIAIETRKCESDSAKERIRAVKQEIQQGSPVECQSSGEYHMTIAHEQAPPLCVKAEEQDQDIDVCEDGGSALLNIKKEEVSDTNTGGISQESAVVEPTIHLSSAQPKSLTSMYSAQTDPSPKSSAVSLSSSDCAAAESQALTVIKDPYADTRCLQVAEGVNASRSLTLADSSVKSTMASSPVSHHCTITTSSVTTATAQIKASPMSAFPSLPTSLVKPKISLLSNGDTSKKLPISSLQQHQQQQQLQHKVIVIKPNTGNPTAAIQHMSQKTVMQEKPFLRNTALPSNSYKLQAGSGLDPAMLTPTQAAPSPSSHTPAAKPAAPRQVSLLTGLVVQPRPPVSHGTHRTASPASLVSVGNNVLSASGQTPVSATAPAVNTHLRLDHSSSPPHRVIVLNKTGAGGLAHNTVATTEFRPSPQSIIGQGSTPVSLLQKQSVIKVLNKSSTPHNISHVLAPVKVINANTKRIESQVRPITIVSNHPSIPAQPNQLRISSAPGTSKPEHLVVSQTSTQRVLASPPVVLSLSGRSTVSLANDLQTPPHFEKMSAVGITKHGKGYRSILPPQDARKDVSQEDRLKGQYEVLRAFKENPELYQKKNKKIVLASNDRIEGEEDVIPKLQLEDYLTMRALVKAAVLLHPIVQAEVNKLTHPYCAKSLEEWNSWTIGKQRASEWHRACFTLRYLRSCLAGQTEFRGQSLMTKRQLVDWCRRHAFSPVVSAKPAPSERKDKDASQTLASAATTSESFYRLLLRNQPQSLSLLDDLYPVLSAEAKNLTAAGQLREEEILNVVDKDTCLSSVKEESVLKGDEEDEVDAENWLVPSSGAVFVHEQLRKRGVNLQAQKLDNGVMAPTAAEMIYKVMQEFCKDVLREALAVCENPSSDCELTVRDVHRGLASLPEAAFCCNRFLGKHDDQEFAPTR